MTSTGATTTVATAGGPRAGVRRVTDSFTSCWRAWAVSCVIGALTLAGCGRSDPQAALSGSVSFDGRAIETGDIRLFPLEGVAGYGASTKIVEGRYDIRLDAGLYVGEYLVAISATRATGGTVAGEGLPGEPDRVPEVVQYIPEHFNARSQLRVDLADGLNEKDFELHGQE